MVGDINFMKLIAKKINLIITRIFIEVSVNILINFLN